MTDYIKKKQKYITKKVKVPGTEPELPGSPIYNTSDKIVGYSDKEKLKDIQKSKKSEPKAWVTKKIRTHHFKSGGIAAGMRRFNRGGKV